MIKIEQVRTDENIILNMEGRIDTVTSPKLQEEILNAFQKMNHIVLNFDKVGYISSAGLRALLIGQKTAASKKGSMILKNVSDEVKSVLKMTGFLNVLTIQD